MATTIYFIPKINKKRYMHKTMFKGKSIYQRRLVQVVWALVPLKQGLEFESCEWRKSVMGELYPLLGQQQLDSSKMEDPRPKKINSIIIVTKELDSNPTYIDFVPRSLHLKKNNLKIFFIFEQKFFSFIT